MAPNIQSKTQTQFNQIEQEENDVICKFGVITDAQFANCEDRPAWYNKDKRRYYRGAITHLRKAFNHWDSMKVKPKFVLQLGDLIDGLNNEEVGCNSLDALEETFKLFEEFSDIATFHAVGNHELYNFSRTDIALLFRESLINRGKLNPEKVHLQLNFHSSDLSDENTLLYYKFQPQQGIKVIALDTFDVSIIGHSPDSLKYKQAAEILSKNNHSCLSKWDYDEHLEGLNKRFQTQNGGLSENQLKWLKNELEESEKNNEKVVVYGHTGLHPDSCDASCLAYNYDEVLKIFSQFSCVICYLSGHAHTSGYSVDENGIHYIVLHGIIETCPSSDAFATITIKKDQLIVDGKGSEMSLVLPINTMKRKTTETVDMEIDDEFINEERSENTDKFNDYEEIPGTSSIVEVSV